MRHESPLISSHHTVRYPMVIPLSGQDKPQSVPPIRSEKKMNFPLTGDFSSQPNCISTLTAATQQHQHPSTTTTTITDSILFRFDLFQIACVGQHTERGVRTMRHRHVRLHDGTRNGGNQTMFQNWSIRWRSGESAIPFSRRIAVPLFGRTVFGVPQIGNQQIRFGWFWNRLLMLRRTIPIGQTSAGHRGESHHLFGDASNTEAGSQRCIRYHRYLKRCRQWSIA